MCVGLVNVMGGNCLIGLCGDGGGSKGVFDF